MSLVEAYCAREEQPDWTENLYLPTRVDQRLIFRLVAPAGRLPGSPQDCTTRDRLHLWGDETKGTNPIKHLLNASFSLGTHNAL